MNFTRFETFFSLTTSVILGVMGLAQVSNNPPDQEQRQQAEKLQKEVQVPTQGVARVLPTKESNVYGMIWLTQTKDGLKITGDITGLTPGEHGFHIHEFGDLSDPEGKSAGGHFNPANDKHGGPEMIHHHAGDLGNIVADNEGRAKIDIDARWLKLHFVVGRSFVVHAGADDLESQPSGDSGKRLAVGVIGIAQTKQNDKHAAK